LDYKEFAKSILPRDLLEYFEVTQVKIVPGAKEEDDYYLITLEEHNSLPAGFKLDEYESKGFYKARLIQDFPIRGKAVYLEIHRRRWRHKSSKQNIHRDFSLIAAGTKFTKELADFLKQAH
jgi:transposase